MILMELWWTMKIICLIQQLKQFNGQGKMGIVYMSVSGAVKRKFISKIKGDEEIISLEKEIHNGI